MSESTIDHREVDDYVSTLMDYVVNGLDGMNTFTKIQPLLRLSVAIQGCLIDGIAEASEQEESSDDDILREAP